MAQWISGGFCLHDPVAVQLKPEIHHLCPIPRRPTVFADESEGF